MKRPEAKSGQDHQATSARQLLSKLEIELAAHIIEMNEQKMRCTALPEEAQRFVENSIHRCVAGELNVLGAQLIEGADLVALVRRAREPLQLFYLRTGFDPEVIGMISEYDAERAAGLVLRDAMQQLRRTILAEEEARKTAAAELSRVTEEARRSSLAGKFRAARRALKL
jgi:hypothetical protein